MRAAWEKEVGQNKWEEMKTGLDKKKKKGINEKWNEKNKRKTRFIFKKCSDESSRSVEIMRDDNEIWNVN